MESKSATKQARPPKQPKQPKQPRQPKPPKKKPIKKTEKSDKITKCEQITQTKTGKKRERVDETAIVLTTDNDAEQAQKPIGQLAKSIRCSQFWNKQNATEAEATGGILMRHGEIYVAGQTAEENKYTKIEEIRSSKKYAQGQQEVLQDQALTHLDNMEMMTELQEKRTVDLKTVSTYHAILASLAPQFAQIHYQPREHVICDTIHTYMHLPEPELSKLNALRKSLNIIAKKSKSTFATKEGIIAFIREYTKDDYYTDHEGVLESV